MMRALVRSPTDMYPTSSEGLNKETGDAVYFFTPAFDALNPFSAHRISIWSHEFSTVEHAFQWKKFSQVRPDVAEKILGAGSPHAAKEIANAHKADIPSSWHEEKVVVMESLFRAKVEQHPDVREQLQLTGNRQIVESSPVDRFWGIGPKQDGQNMVGKIWMKIREAK